jgi:hypothetical protein
MLDQSAGIPKRAHRGAMRSEIWEMVRAWGLEPQRLAAREPKSRMSANFIMPAYILLYHISFTAARRKFIAMRACAIYNEAARDL